MIHCHFVEVRAHLYTYHPPIVQNSSGELPYHPSVYVSLHNKLNAPAQTWDLRSDFPSYSVNLGGVNFSGRSIPSMSWENGVWYLKPGHANDWPCQNDDFVRCRCYLLLSLVRKLPSQFCLALSVSQRSILEWAQLGNALCLLNATDLLSLWLSRLIWDLCCLLFQPSWDDRFDLLDCPWMVLFLPLGPALSTCCLPRSVSF